jgi:branched-chain amino acid transport system permease protein
MDVESLIQQLVNGLSLGGQYALWAVGYGLVYQVLGLMHFAHGDSIIFPAFVGFALLSTGTPLPIVVIVCLALGAAVAVTIERVVYRPLVSRGEIFLAFVAALAAAYVLRNVGTLIWGFDTKVWEASLVPDFTVQLGDVAIRGIEIANIVVAFGAVGLFQLYLTKTRMGQGIQAVAQGRETAALMGVPVGKVVAFVYALSGAIGVLGVLLYLSDQQALTVGLGFTITLKAFIAALIGGIGSVRGAVVGGMLLGILEALIAGYISTLLLNAILFSILGLVLIFMPYGLMGRKTAVRL